MVSSFSFSLINIYTVLPIYLYTCGAFTHNINISEVKRMKKVFKALTQAQEEQGVIFTSCLSKYRTEQPGDTVHIVKNTDVDKYEKITRLKDDSFFNASPFKFNIIRTHKI